MKDPAQPRSFIRLDLVPNDLLTPEELVAFTGYDAPYKQIEVLTRNHIRFFTVRDCEVRTTWYHINNPIDLRSCSCQNPGSGRWQQTVGPKADEFPPPDSETLESKLQAFNPNQD